MIPTAILIHGRKGVGKDTLGRHLYLQSGYFQTAIADVLKLFLEESNPPMLIKGYETRLSTLLRYYKDWDKAKRLQPEVRELLTSFGQGARNVFGEDFWVKRYAERLNDFRREFSHITQFVVTDIRYENELTSLKDYFGPEARSLKLIRANHEADGHPSEEGIPDHLFDMVLENNAAPEDLFRKMQFTLGIWDGETEETAA